MRPKSMSATALESYEGCAMRFLAEVMTRNRVGSPPADFGTALHAAMDKYIEKLNISPGIPAKHNPELLTNLWTASCAHYLGWGSEYEERGREILEHWLDTRPLPYKVLSREIKDSFIVKVGEPFNGEQKWNYICDRIDENEDGSIEVVDYKSQWEMVTPEKMRRLVQPVLYASAVRRMYGVDEVTVTYDMLRYETISVVFTSNDMDKFEDYLSAVTARIWADDEPQETLNKGCVWCIRRGTCETLRRATDVGWLPTMPIEELVARRHEIKSAQAANERSLADIDDIIMEQLRRDEIDEVSIGGYHVKAKTKRTGSYDAEAVHRVLGDAALPFFRVGKTALEKALFAKRNPMFDADQAQAVKALVNYTFSDEPTLEIVPEGPSEVE